MNELHILRFGAQKYNQTIYFEVYYTQGLL